MFNHKIQVRKETKIAHPHPQVIEILSKKKVILFLVISPKPLVKENIQMQQKMIIFKVLVIKIIMTKKIFLKKKNFCLISYNLVLNNSIMI